MKEQVLDSMDIERERGITIKAQTVRLNYTRQERRGLRPQPDRHARPCRLRLRGVALARRLRGLAAGGRRLARASRRRRSPTSTRRSTTTTRSSPVLNKIDLPAAEPERISEQIEDVIGIDASDAVLISAKTGLGIDDVLEAIVHQLPPPRKGDADAPLKALLVDSWYDAYLGVVVLVRVIDGVLKKGQTIRMMGTGAKLPGRPHRRLHPQQCSTSTSSAPARSASSPARSRRWPTPASATPSPRTAARPRRRCPASSRRSRWCSAASSRSTPPTSRICAPPIGKLRLNDASFSYEMETSRRARLRLPLRLPRPAAPRDHPGAAGARVRPRPDRHRALGRLPAQPDRRHARSSCTTRPTCPTSVKIAAIEEPWIRATILTPDDYLGAILKLCQDRRGIQADLSYVGNRAMVVYDLPLNEVVFDFYDRLKSISKGYASLRLPPHRLPRGRPGEDVDPGQRRAGRRALDAGPPHARPKSAAAPCARS